MTRPKVFALFFCAILFASLIPASAKCMGKLDELEVKDAFDIHGTIAMMKLESVEEVEFSAEAVKRFFSIENGAPSATPLIRRLQYKSTLAKRLVFSYDNMKFRHIDTSLKEYSGSMKNENVAMLYKKIGFGKNREALLVLGEGFHSISAIYLYPISADGIIGQGLLVADKFGDEERLVKISSKINSNSNQPYIVVRVQRYQIEEDIPGSTKLLSDEYFTFRYAASSGWKMDSLK